MKKYRELNNAQSGQIIVFVAITLVVILGFAGLAIDGGRLYNDRRITQGTADTMAFTGALVIGQYIVDNPTSLITKDGVNVELLAINAAYARAEENGYLQSDPDKDISVDISTAIFDDGIYYLVTVEITSRIPPTFIQLVYDGPLESTARAVAKARPRQSLAYGFSIFASDPHGCKGVEFGGTSDILVEGGGVFSNSDACLSNCNSLVAGGAIEVEVLGGRIKTAGCVELNGGALLSPTPDEHVYSRTEPPLATPNCQDNIDIDESGNFSTVLGSYGTAYVNIHDIEFLKPGRYDEISNVGGDIFLAPGLYCIGSGGFSMTSGSVQGTGVTFFVYDGGDVKLTGGFVDISAPVDDLIDGDDNHWTGMMIYMVGDGLISLGGNGDMVYTGTIMALDPPAQSNAAKCDLNGNGDFIGFDVQLICWSIRYTGGANSYLRYSPPKNYYYPATIDLDE